MIYFAFDFHKTCSNVNKYLISSFIAKKAACDEFSIDDTKLGACPGESLDSVKECFDPKKYKFEYNEAHDVCNIVEGKCLPKVEAFERDTVDV